MQKKNKKFIIFVILILLTIIILKLVIDVKETSNQLNLYNENLKNSDILGMKTIVWLGDSLMTGTRST